MDNACEYRLIFLRHGQTDWNVQGRLQGQRDIRLNGKGRDQAQSVGRACRSQLNSELSFIASPLQRARETMEIARRAMGLVTKSYQTDDRLKEISFGQWEGMTWREIEAHDPKSALAREADKWGYAPPEGESYFGLSERVRSFLKCLSGDTLIVSHGGVARVMMALIGGVSKLDALNQNIYQGRPLLFEGGRYQWLS